MLQAHWARRACRENEADTDPPVLWGNVEKAAMLAKPVLWVQ